MDAMEVGEFIDKSAPDDVRETIAWLLANGYQLTSSAADNAFGAQFVYTAEAQVVITVDRAQWMLDVARGPGATAWQFDLLVVASRGLPYAEVFPGTGDRTLNDPLPKQLPRGVAWRTALPDVLRWLVAEDDEGPVRRARTERNRLMWRTR